MKRAGVNPAYIGTIHRLVYQPDVGADGAIRGWKRADALPYDLLVIDEASMVPTKILEDLLTYRVPILAVGDHGQLPPVGEDAGVMASPDLRLERIHRQALGNPIIALSAAIRQGAALSVIFKAIEEVNAKGDKRVSLIRAGRSGLVDALRFTTDPSTSMMICYTNATRIGMNAAARKARGLAPDGPPVKGESVICLRNNYGYGELLANGARGILEANAEKTINFRKDFGGTISEANDFYRAPVAFEDGRTLDVDMLACQFGRLTFSKYEEIAKAGGPKVYSWDQVGVLADFGYCLTCHKAQGSQADRVAVILEGALGAMDADERKRWLYTAVTRAANELMLVQL
jgi:exodeoxyribonuclease-5